VLVRLQTADQIRLASLVQEEQGATASSDWTGIMRFAMGEEHDALALHFSHGGRRIFSVMRRFGQQPRLAPSDDPWPHKGLPSLGQEHT
jgi:hypothetical protein